MSASEFREKISKGYELIGCILYNPFIKGDLESAVQMRELKIQKINQGIPCEALSELMEYICAQDLELPHDPDSSWIGMDPRWCAPERDQFIPVETEGIVFVHEQGLRLEVQYAAHEKGNFCVKLTLGGDPQDSHCKTRIEEFSLSGTTVHHQKNLWDNSYITYDILEDGRILNVIADIDAGYLVFDIYPGGASTAKEDGMSYMVILHNRCDRYVDLEIERSDSSGKESESIFRRMLNPDLCSAVENSEVATPGLNLEILIPELRQSTKGGRAGHEDWKLRQAVEHALSPNASVALYGLGWVSSLTSAILLEPGRVEIVDSVFEHAAVSNTIEVIRAQLSERDIFEEVKATAPGQAMVYQLLRDAWLENVSRPIVTDLNGTLCRFTDEGLKPYKQVIPAIQNFTVGEELIVLSGGNLSTITNFFEREGLFEKKGIHYIPGYAEGRNIRVLSRVGMEELYFDDRSGHYAVRHLHHGLSYREIAHSILCIEDVVNRYALDKRFSKENGYHFEPGTYPGYFFEDVHEGRGVLKFCPAGRLTEAARHLFVSQDSNHLLMRQMVSDLNAQLPKGVVYAARGGDTTIEILPTSKKEGMQYINSGFNPQRKPIYLGDQFTRVLQSGDLMTGNDQPVLPLVDRVVCFGDTHIDSSANVFLRSVEIREYEDTSGVSDIINAVAAANRLSYALVQYGLRNKV